MQAVIAGISIYIDPNDGIICPACGKHIDKESQICDNCGLKL